MKDNFFFFSINVSETNFVFTSANIAMYILHLHSAVSQSNRNVLDKFFFESFDITFFNHFIIIERYS